MSIILDALRKSESERLRDAEAHRSELPRARGKGPMPWWVWGVALLLVANIALLLWLVLRPAAPAATSVPGPVGGREVRDLERLAAAGTETTGSAAAGGAPRRTPDIPPAQFPVRGVEPEVATAEPRSLPPPSMAGQSGQGQSTLAQRAADAVAAEGNNRMGNSPARGEASSGLPTTLPEGVPPLQVSLHYYDSASGRSFISVNGRTARDGTVLPEGPQVERVTEEGAILNYRGQRFLLPRN